MTDDIGYQALTQAAMRGVMREALTQAAGGTGLPGGHHFYITFRTKAPGVKIAEHLQSRFPEEMMIVIQHQFWDLEIHPRHFEIVLQFSGVPQHLEIPFSAVTRFHDPSVDFMMVFDQSAGAQAEISDPVPEGLDEATDTPEADVEDEAQAEEARPASDGTVVQLDTFRRK
tara:strand:- start:11739 stop:12251 length:513 start_codon:yes stop_codon:yes gene_type:complete